jgi:hypothetical protein
MDGVLWIEIACIAKDWDFFTCNFRNSGKREMGIGKSGSEGGRGWSFVLLHGCMIR